jgi:hypothetical protein
MCEWIESDWADCIGLSEIPGWAPVETARFFLESLWYTVSVTESFDLWSQDLDYQLFQIVGVRGEYQEITQQVFYKKYPWLYAVFYGVVGATLARSFSLGIKIYTRLREWVRDGAIIVVEYPDHSLYVGHIHYWCNEIEAFLSSNLGHTLKPALIIGDMNVPSAGTLLRRNFFKKSILKWIDHLVWLGKTFGFNAHLYPLWMRWFMYHAPDVILARGIVVELAENILSLSDHNRIACNYAVSELRE